MALVDLPPELLIAIVGHVDGRTLARCRLVCRRLRDVFDGSLEVQYRIELEQDGMTSLPASVKPTPTSSEPSSSVYLAPPASNLALATTADRLARLRQLRRAWSTLAWTRRVSVPMPGPCYAYELVGGVFCKTQPRRKRVWWGSLGVALGHGGGGDGQGQGGGHGGEQDEYGSRLLTATWLPGPDSDLNETRAGAGAGTEVGSDARAGHGTGTGGAHTVVRDDLGISTRDFAMDPSQDLMILFRGGEDVGFAAFSGVLELHVRTMSTNQTHPEARAPILCAPVLYPVSNVFVQIVEDVVGMMYCVDPARPRLTIWNWKTGLLIADRSSGLLPAYTWDFSFINSRALFVTTGYAGGTLELFRFTCDPPPETNSSDASGSSSDSTSSSGSRLTHLASLHLPPLHPASSVLGIGTHTGPFLAGRPANKPFAASNADRIHVISVQYVRLPSAEGPGVRPNVCVILQNRTLERFLDAGAQARRTASENAVGNGKDETGPMAVPWNEWGRQHARMLPHVGTFQWLRYVHGQRFVLLQPTLETSKCTLRVLDFNVHRAFDDTPPADDNGDDDDSNPGPSLGKIALERVDHTTRITIPAIFADDVETSLPYREVRRNVLGDYSGVMIDDERLVGLKYPAFLTGDMKEIDVFTM